MLRICIKWPFFIYFAIFNRNDSGVMLLFLGILLMAVLLSTNKIFLFYVLSSVLLIFTVWHYFANYLKKRSVNTLLVLLAMIFLLFGTLHLMYSVENESYYVIGHVLEFIAYVLLLTNLVIILKHGKKKR